MSSSRNAGRSTKREDFGSNGVDSRDSSNSGEPEKVESKLAHLFRRARSSFRKSTPVSFTPTAATASSSSSPFDPISRSCSPHRHGERPASTGQHYHHHHHHHYYHHHHHHHHHHLETTAPFRLLDVQPPAPSTLSPTENGSTQGTGATEQSDETSSPENTPLPADQGRARFSPSNSSRNMAYNRISREGGQYGFSNSGVTSAGGANAADRSLSSLDSPPPHVPQTSWTSNSASPNLYGTTTRRQVRRGPLRRMLFRRQRWMLADYDWNMYDFESRYYLHPQHIRLLEYFDDLSHEEMLALAEHMGTVSCGLSDAELARIPIETITNMEEDSLDSSRMKDEERTCTICLDDFVNGNTARKLKCGHQFHVACVDPWLKQNKLCPVCKTELEQLSVSQDNTARRIDTDEEDGSERSGNSDLPRGEEDQFTRRDHTDGRRMHGSNSHYTNGTVNEGTTGNSYDGSLDALCIEPN